MASGAALRRLADRLGIATGYTDALGESRTASDEALLALIAAFGFGCDPERAWREIDAHEREKPLGLDPAYIIGDEQEAPRLRLRLPAGCRALAWRCRLETGGELSGAIDAEAGADRETFALALPTRLPLGYHRFEIETRACSAGITLIVAPVLCHLPPTLAPHARNWGILCQLYGLRSGRNWGIGDFTDLARLAGAAGGLGAAVLGTNPLHALFAAEPRHISPYSPSSRTRLNIFYLDPTAVPGFADAPTAGQDVEAARHAAQASELVDYSDVAAGKRTVLEALFDRFRAHDLATGSDAERTFRKYQCDGGAALADFATFEALDEHHRGNGLARSWQGWPRPLRDPRSPEVAAFAAAHRDRIEFFQFLQWQAEEQLAAAAAAGRKAGLSIGLYRDLAVGADPGGAEAWADQQLIAPGAAIGAPPDFFNRAGQNWGLAPVNPLVLRRQGFAPFVEQLRANMRHAGVLRIDHVMSLARLYWIPSGMNAAAGAYVRYPLDELLRLVALESRRQQCAVIGEDLGTVPEGFRERMQGANVLSCRIFYFERKADGGFAAPAQYPALAAAAAATHDMPTLKGFWLGKDIAWRRRLGLYPDAQAVEADAAERRRDRRLLLTALAEQGLIATDRFGDFLSPDGEPSYTAELGAAILAYLARSHARLLLVQLEDLAGESEQANLPGTTDAHPNWRRRLSRTIEGLLADTDLRRLAARIAAERRRAAAA